MILGVDISSHEDSVYIPTSINYSRMWHAGGRFLFLRAGAGSAEDVILRSDLPKAVNMGFVVGTFWYLYWTVKLQTQIDLFLKAYRECTPHLAPCIDYEHSGSGYTKADLSKRLLTMAHALYDETGLYPIIYTNPNYWTNYGTVDPWIENCPLWIAHWWTSKPFIPKPWKAWEFWQFAVWQDGYGFGVETKGIDLNVYQGDYNQLIKTAGIERRYPESMAISERLERLERIHPL